MCERQSLGHADFDGSRHAAVSPEKNMRKIAAVLLLFVALVGAALFWLSGNIDGQIKDALENYGSANAASQVSMRLSAIFPSQITRADPRRAGEFSA